MPIVVSIDKEHDLVTRTVQDTVTIEELLESLEKTYADPDYHRGMNSLTDIRNASQPSSSQDLRQVARTLIANQSRIAGGKAAVVVGRTVSYGLVRMLQSYIDGLDYELGVFYDFAEAKEWLRTGRVGAFGSARAENRRRDEYVSPTRGTL